MNQTKDELHDKAWKLLEEKGLTTGERMMVKSNFASAYKDEYPFIGIKYNKGEVHYYHSEIPEIKSLGFKTENEVILANAIYNMVKDRFNINEFVQQVKFVNLILRAE